AFDLVDWSLLQDSLEDADAILDPQWLAQGATTFADDYLLQDTAVSYRELERAHHRFASVLDALIDHGMKINTQKSAFLMRHRGHFARKWLKQHLVRTPEGYVIRIRTPKARLFEFPLKDKHVYLGVVIGYHSPSKQTVTHRLQEANGTWQRLRKILCSQSSLPTQERVKLWQSTVLPTMLYGVAASSPGHKDIQRMQHVATRHLRAITRSFAHLSKEPTATLLARIGVQPLQLRLASEAESLCHTLLNLQNQLHPLAAEVRDMVRETAASLQAKCVITGEETEPADAAGLEAYTCQDCGEHFRIANLRLLPPRLQKVAQSFPAYSMAQMPRLEASSSPPLIQWQLVAHALAKGAWTTLLNQSSVQEYLKHRIDIGSSALFLVSAPTCRFAMTPSPQVDMDLDLEETQFFQRFSTKRGLDLKAEESQKSQRTEAGREPKGKGKGKSKGKTGGKGKGKGKQLPKPTWSSQWEDYADGYGQHGPPWTGSHDNRPEEHLQYHLRKLTQVVLRQERTLASVRQDLVMHLFVKTGEDSGNIIPTLFRAAEVWREMKEQEPAKIQYSLKIMLFKQLLMSLHERLQETAANQEAMKAARDLNWIDGHQQWQVLRWCAETQQLKLVPQAATKSTEDLLRQLVEIRKNVTEETLHHFKSVRKLVPNPTTQWVQFQVEVSLRPGGHPIWTILQEWVGMAAWHTIGCRLRRDRPGYDNAIDELYQLNRW
ncbi:unnamed protein product, partial [Symbiodinium sp. CCMP2456]